MNDTPQPSPSGTGGAGLPYENHINKVEIEDVFLWLAAGWRDFKASGIVSFSCGLIFVIAGLVMTVGMYYSGFEYLIAPAIQGFLLIGPSLTVGFYAISRSLEVDENPSIWKAVSAWRTNKISLIAMGLAQLMFLVVWLRISVLIFALSFPYTPFDLQSMLNAILFTMDGYIFLAVGTLFGSLLAFVAFATGAISLPYMMDKKVGLIQGIVTSVVAVIVNFKTMMVWAAAIVTITGAGLLTGFIGLAFTLPLVGHASWHAYRALIKQEATLQR
ncbi:MAG: DUF2189 domain-containing protein [Alphaproteobacteria bacterium]|nr:DUF2189 domain-containing protein [Rhodospirillales bacterium]MCW9044971.1 DUF2189 domain-containing protein [Alphaproteobacteria bacterium]